MWCILLSLKRTWQTVDSFISKKIPHLKLVRTVLMKLIGEFLKAWSTIRIYRKEYYDIINEWKNGNLEIKIEGGESAQDLADRLLPFIEELKANKRNKQYWFAHMEELYAF
jgi:broad specificity phosphatase PhoE